MAKKGFDYFPIEVDIFEDTKLQLLSSEFGVKGELIFIRLLCKIYGKNGYYYPWNEDEALLFAKSVGNGITGALVNEIVQGCIKRSLFNKRVFEASKILTGKGIQERYLKICKQLKREPDILPKYDCVSIPALKKDFPELYAEIPEKVEEIPEKSPLRKGREEKERKGSNHPEFLHSFLEPVNAEDVANVCRIAGCPSFRKSWGEVFNAHLATKRITHKTYEDWLSHLSNWFAKAYRDLANNQPIEANKPKYKELL